MSAAASLRLQEVTQLILWLASGVSNEGQVLPSWYSCRNAQKAGFGGKKWARYGLSSVNKDGDRRDQLASPGILQSRLTEVSRAPVGPLFALKAERRQTTIISAGSRQPCLEEVRVGEQVRSHEGAVCAAAC